MAAIAAAGVVGGFFKRESTVPQLDQEVRTPLLEKILLDFKKSNSSLAMPVQQMDVTLRRASVLSGEAYHPPDFDSGDLALPALADHSDFRAPNREMTVLAREIIRASLQTSLTFDCMAIEPAFVATLLSLRRKYGLSINISYSGRIGREQLERMRGEPDFIVTALGPMMLVETELRRIYELALPIHQEEEFLVVPAAHSSKADSALRIKFYSSSACEEMLIVMKDPAVAKLIGLDQRLSAEELDAIRRAEEFPIEGLDQLMNAYQNLEQGEAGVLWSPTGDKLTEHSNLRRVGAPFRHSICLFAHRRRWTRGAARNRLLTLLRLVRHEWMVCEANPSWTYELLALDSGFLASFREAIG